MKTLSLLGILACGLLATMAAAGPAREPAAAATTPSPCLAGSAEYVGAKSCKSCHFGQWRSWSKTQMAKAFDTLKPGVAAEAKKKHGLDPRKDYTADASCLQCHTTGYGKPGGYPAVVEGKKWSAEERATAEAMEGVQCEACHGPGSLTAPLKKENPKYRRAELLEKGMIEPKKANCETCHNTRSPTVGEGYVLDYDALIKDETKIHKHQPLKYEH